MQIPTHFEDEMEQTELHSAQLVDVEVSICPFSPNTEVEIGSDNHVKIESARKIHTTRLWPLSFFPVSFMYETRDKEGPHPDYVADNIQQPRKKKIKCLNCPSQRLPRLHPITMLSAPETRDDKFRHQKGVGCPKHSGSSFL